jgi:leucyl-tRNA synthetase
MTAMKRYDPKIIEPKWQKLWADTELYKTDTKSSKPKVYVLDYFPYPSGSAMHMGHVRNYTISDVVSRYERMKGNEVLHPMGWDAFGLPAENFAIKNNISPAEAIKQNTERFKNQFMVTGMSYDWSREINSSDPAYYKWTQWFFLMLFKKGLAYRKNSLVNWCPVDKTVLANEQVIVKDGVNVCERCGSPVEKKKLKQWFFKITDYADRLLEDLDELNWPDNIKSMQRNWIGRSFGANIDFEIDGHDKKLKIFTTRPDTIFGATFMVLAPEHPMVKEITSKEQAQQVERYVEKTAGKTELDRKQDEKKKSGVFTGAYAINPANNEKIPIWIGDFVLMGYGEGAIMSVPAHDQRDYEFATKYKLPITQVVMPCEPDAVNPPKPGLEQVVRETVIVHLQDKSTGKFALLNWHGSLEGITTAIMGGIEPGQTAEEAALMEIEEEAGLKDVKIISRSPWLTGAEYCASHKNQNRKALATVLLAEVDDLTSQLEIERSEQKLHTLVWVDKKDVENSLVPAHQKQVWNSLWVDSSLSAEGEMINSGKYDGMSSSEAREKIVADLEKKELGHAHKTYKLRDWLISRQRYWGAPIPIVHCQDCGEVAVEDSQLPVTLPEMADFHPSGDGRGPLARDENWLKTTCPKCGKPAERETDTMDGFACSSWYFLRFVDPNNSDMPADPKLLKEWLPVDKYIGGAEHAVMHLLYARFWTKVMFDEGVFNFKEPFSELRNQGMLQAEDGQKISKRLGNYLPPEKLIDNGYGADALRSTVLFLAPYDQDVAWSNDSLAGLFRFIGRVWTLVGEYVDDQASTRVHEKDGNEIALTQLAKVTDQTVKKVTSALERMSFNTAIASMMELVNSFNQLRTEVSIHQASVEWSEALTKLLKIMAPIMPHVTEELWAEMGNKNSIHLEMWPTWDEELIKEDLITIVVQVNGKMRSTLTMPVDSTEEDVVVAAKNDENTKSHLGEGEIKKTIFVKGKLVNFVV